MINNHPATGVSWPMVEEHQCACYGCVYGKCTTFGMVHHLLVTIKNLVTMPAAAGIGSSPALPPYNPGPLTSTPSRKCQKFGPAMSPESITYS